MTKGKKDDNVWGLEEDDNELSLEFTFNRSIRIEGFSLYFDRN